MTVEAGFRIGDEGGGFGGGRRGGRGGRGGGRGYGDEGQSLNASPCCCLHTFDTSKLKCIGLQQYLTPQQSITQCLVSWTPSGADKQEFTLMEVQSTDTSCRRVLYHLSPPQHIAHLCL